METVAARRRLSIKSPNRLNAVLMGGVRMLNHPELRHSRVGQLDSASVNWENDEKVQLLIFRYLSFGKLLNSRATVMSSALRKDMFEM